VSEEGNDARQQIRLWLAEGYTPTELRDRYEELLEITGSKMSRKTYDRTIYKVRKQNRRMESGGKIEKDKQATELNFEQRGNEMFVESKTGGRIKNLDDLIREAEVDLDVWKVDEHTVNPYEVTMKLKVNGDMLDLPEWSDKFLQSPETWWTLQPAMLELSWWLKRLRENLPEARMVYMEGNHEERMPRSILRYQASAYGLKRVDNLEGIEVLSIPNLLALDQLAVEWRGGYPANHVWLNSEFRVSHGNGTGFDKMLKEAEVSESIGHIHKLVKQSKTRHVRGGEKVVELSSSGCMARRDGAVPGSEDRMDWQGGFELVNYEPDGKLFETQLVHVNGDRTLFNGHSITARDRREDIMRDYAQEAPFLRFE